MTEFQWRDVTHYSDDPDETPTTWEVVANGQRLCITTCDPLFDGEWVLHFDAIGLRSYPLEIHADAGFEVAAKKAVDVVKLKTQRILTAINLMKVE